MAFIILLNDFVHSPLFFSEFFYYIYSAIYSAIYSDTIAQYRSTMISVRDLLIHPRLSCGEITTLRY